MDTLSWVVGAATERVGLCGEGTKARHGRSDGYRMRGDREGSMQRLSMEDVSFKAPSLMLTTVCKNQSNYSLLAYPVLNAKTPAPRPRITAPLVYTNGP